MALIIAKVIHDSGIKVTNAYAKIGFINGNKEWLNMTLDYFMDQQSSNENKGIIKRTDFTFIPSIEDNSPNFIKQGYEYLKSLSEFQDAIDVLE